MNGYLFLAESAEQRADKTVDMVRGFIDQFNVVDFPARLQAKVVFCAKSGFVDLGEHPVDIQVIDEDGKAITDPVTGALRIDRGGVTVPTVLNFDVVFGKPGRYEIAARVDNVELASWTLTVKPKAVS